MVSSQYKLQLFSVEQLKNVGVDLMKEALMRGIKETFVEASKLGLHSVNSGIKSAFFRLLEKALVIRIH